MYAAILKGRKSPDTACFVDGDGNLSNGDLHAAIMKGVKQDEQITWAREQCQGKLSAEQLDLVFPE